MTPVTVAVWQLLPMGCMVPAGRRRFSRQKRLFDDSSENEFHIPAGRADLGHLLTPGEPSVEDVPKPGISARCPGSIRRLNVACPGNRMDFYFLHGFSLDAHKAREVGVGNIVTCWETVLVCYIGYPLCEVGSSMGRNPFLMRSDFFLPDCASD